MLRETLLQPRGVALVIVAWAIIVSAAPHLADAAPLPPTRGRGDGAELETLRVLLEQKIVREQLLALGVSPTEAVAILDRLSPDERAEWAARAQELSPGGLASVGPLLALTLIAVTLIILIVVLVKRAMGRPVTS